MHELFGWLESQASTTHAKLVATNTWFDQHMDSYVAEGFVCNAIKEEVCYLITSVHCIRNAYRQEASGFRSMCCVDLTHKLVKQGHSVFVFGTRDLAQKYRPICWGVFSEKSEDIHEYAFRSIKAEIERVINDRTGLYPELPSGWSATSNAGS